METHHLKQLQDILQNNFAMSSIGITPLVGYDSYNYKVKSNKGSFVLKQYPNSPEIITLVKSENQVLNRLSNLKNYDFPLAVVTQDGEDLVINEDFVYRLLSFVEGEFLGDVIHTPDLMQSFGVFLGSMDKILLTTYDTAIAARHFQWDLKHFNDNKIYLPYITNSKDRNLAAYFFMQFNEQVSPVQHLLRKGIIHNDANDWNVLTTNGKVAGIIDFGDMCNSWIINELAIGITYIMMGKEEPLESALPVIRGYHNIFPLEEKELDVLYYLVAARLCTSVCNSAYSKTMKPSSDYITVSEKGAWDLLHKWLSLNPIRAKDAFRKTTGFPYSKKPKFEYQLKRRKNYLSDALSLSYKNPIEMSQSAFQYMYDTSGNTFLDAYNNIMLAGHCHPIVVQAGQRTMAKLNTNTRYLYEELLVYSEKLLSKFPSRLNKVFFVNSGSAATDLAIRIAMKYTRKNKVMVLEHGYHGNTRIGIDISHYKYNNKGGGGKQDYIVQTPMPKAFGSIYKDDGTAGNHFASQMAVQLKRNNGEIAAFIAEPIMGCGGQVPLAKGYLQEVYPKIREQGGICISDEVQVGFGRLGEKFWGFEMHDVVPDMVILGKPMANGHPIGAVVTTTEIAQSFENGPEFFSSFGGNPVSCAIGHAVLKVIDEESLQQHAKKVGNHLKGLLNTLHQEYPEIIADIRGSGLFVGVEITDTNGNPNTQLAVDIKNRLREVFILIGTDGPYDNVLKIKPPLSFTLQDSEILVAEIHLILKDLIKF